MPPSRNNTVKFSDLAAISAVGISDLIPVVDTSVPTLVNKKINVQDFNRSLPVSLQVTQLGANSANWSSTYSTTQANSASWSTGGSYGSVYSANSAEYESTFTSVNANSANWNSVYNLVGTASGGFTTLQANSSTWNTGYALASSAYTSLNTLSTGTWLLKAGDQLTGALTTTKTLTTQFTNMDELVSKRYVDAMSTISGNFVPSLYYTKTDFSTNVPVVSTTLLQFGKATIDVPGTPWSGSIAFNKDQFGTDVPAFVFTTTNNNLGGLGRAGIYINSGSAGQFSYSQGTISQNWDGPSFATVYTLSRTGAARLSLYDDINLNSNLNVLGNASTANLVFDNWRSVLCRSVLALSASVTTTGDRLALSGNRLAFESGGAQKLILYPSGSNGAIGWANNIGGFNTIDVYNSQDYAFSRNGNATHVVRCFGTGGQYEVIGSFPTMYTSNNSSGQGHGFTFADNLGGRIGLFPDTPNGMGIMGNMGEMAFRIYKSFTNFSNYERLSLSATRIAYEFAGTGVSRDLTIQSTGNLVLSAGNSLVFNSALPTQISPLSSTNLTAPNGLTVVTGGGTRGVFAIDQFSHGVYSESGGASISSAGNGKLVVIYGSMSYFKNNPNRTLFGVNDDGKIFAGRIGSYFTTTPNVSAHVNITTDSTYNSHVTDMLLLSAGPNTSILNYINCVSAGQTIFSVNSAGQYNTANFSADFVNLNQVGTSASYNTGVLRIPNDVSGQLKPGIWSYGSTTGTPQPAPTSVGVDVSLATFGAGSHNNQASLFSNAIISRRGVFTPNTPTLGSGNFDESISDLALKVAGRIGFTDTTLNASNRVRTVSATMGYDWSTNLIALSSTTSKVGFSLYGSGNLPEIYNDGSLYITSNFGGGRRIYFNGIQNQGWNPLELGPYGAYVYGTLDVKATQQTGTGYTFPYLQITQDVKQLSNLVQVVSSNGSTILSYTSAGVLNLNNRTFLKPEGLIQFNSISSTTPAIKGTNTTIQARTGDDSQYTYLQGKLQTDQAANAGTFTPDKYIILYDSTGTAYKVPVQAL